MKLIQFTTPQSLCDSSPARGAFSEANSKNPPLAGEVPDRAEG